MLDSVAETTTFQLKYAVIEVYPENKESVTGMTVNWKTSCILLWIVQNLKLIERHHTIRSSAFTFNELMNSSKNLCIYIYIYISVLYKHPSMHVCNNTVLYCHWAHLLALFLHVCSITDTMNKLLSIVVHDANITQLARQWPFLDNIMSVVKLLSFLLSSSLMFLSVLKCTKLY